MYGSWKGLPLKRARFSAQGEKKRQPDGQGQEQSFVGAAVGENRQPHSHDRGILPARAFLEADQSAQHQRPAGRRHRATEVGVHPVTGWAETHRSQQPAEQCPAGR